MTMLKNTGTLFVIFLIVSFNTTTSYAGNGRFEQAKKHLVDGIHTYNEQLLYDARKMLIQLVKENPSDYIYVHYVIKNNSGLEKGYINVGIAYQENGEVEKAINTFKRLLEINPDNPEARFFLDRLISTN